MDRKQDRDVTTAVPFGAWLSQQTGCSGFVDQLAIAAASDRRFPKAGNPEGCWPTASPSDPFDYRSAVETRGGAAVCGRQRGPPGDQR